MKMIDRREFLKLTALNAGTIAFSAIVPRCLIAGQGATKANPKRSLTPKMAIQLLIDGNKRYQKGACIGPCPLNQESPDVDISKGPWAIVVTCSDSRIQPNVIFNAAPGSIFIVRNSGNLVDPYVLGSIEEALKRFEIPLILVLSHDDCHALQTAVKHLEQHGSIEPRWVNTLITGLMPAVTLAQKESDLFGRRLADVAAIKNARLQAEKIVSMSKLVKKRVSQGKLKVLYGHYHLDSGIVEIKS